MRRPTLGIWGIILCFYLSIADRNFRSVYMELFEAKEGGLKTEKLVSFISILVLDLALGSSVMFLCFCLLVI